MSLVTISYENLLNNDITKEIIEAFGEDSLGAVLITDIPEFKRKKMKLLKLSKKFGELPEAIQEQYESPETFYSFGWSKGKEKMKGGKPDIAKGSYYANPIYDEPTKDKELIKKYPANYSVNIWPSEHVPTMESHFKFVGNFMYHIGLKVLKSCDKYLDTQIDEYPKNYLHDIIKNSKTYKARLLHYYELPEEKNLEDDASCSWHLDHGGLTILTKAVYLDKNYNEIEEPENCGLSIRDKNGKIHMCVIPENALLCQIGEILQILSGGFLKATAHCVKSAKLKGITRETFPVFIDCPVDQDISLPKWSKENADETKGMKGLIGVPELKNRYKDCKTYYDFVHKTLSAYYN
jgi:isopenicillin N synthase-like dioxygenase